MNALSPFKKILDFIIYSNLFISAAVACFTLQTALFFPARTALLEEFAVLNFISTFILYNLQRLYYASHENLDGKYRWYIRNRRLIFTGMVLLIMCFFSRLFDFFMRYPDYLLAYFVLAILSIFYFLPPVQLRKYGFLKPFIIAFVFVGSSILVPLYSQLSLQHFFYATGQFCFIAVLCILFDIKDLGHDKNLGLATFPARFGLKRTKYFCAALLIFYTGSSVFFYSADVVICFCIVAGISLSACLLSGKRRSAYFYFFLVDGLILFQYFLLQSFGYTLHA